MSSFTKLLVEEGVEVELPAGLPDIIEILDREVRWFSCDGYGYCLSSPKGTVGDRWVMLVQLADLATREPLPSPLGRIEVEKIEEGMALLRIQPRPQRESPEADDFDPEGRFLGSFVYQVLNTCQRLELIQLPGLLPTV